MMKLSMFAPALLMIGCVACTGTNPGPIIELPAPGGAVVAVTEVAPASRHFADATTAAVAAASPDKAVADAAIAYLRDRGPAGLAAMQQVHGAEVAFRLGEAEAGSAPDTETSDRVLRAFDRISGQHDGWASGLFWHRDAESARAEARARGLPILNLWLLGTLDDEFC
ncbi:MAG: hypothetical protein KF754_00420 [Planctomycetes bacterium]|nr:hypothetical protein [Planctomycetota bacterium]